MDSSGLVHVVNAVVAWGGSRGLIDRRDETRRAQLLKAMSELGELADAELKHGRDRLGQAHVEHGSIVDGLGDTLVCLILYSANIGVSIEDALRAVYKVISKRTGKTVNGTFVKDEASS